MPKKKYYPNNWKAYKDSPDEFFIPLSYNDFYQWKIMGWALPSSVACVIREEKDGKISERVYSQSTAANKYLEKQTKRKDLNSVFTICDNHAVKILYPTRDKHLFKDLEMDEGIWDGDLFDEETDYYED
tara:strand:- start:224 stop:610 length:387 start_codon:yes stop_codon:yes gene_type:complete